MFFRIAGYEFFMDAAPQYTLFEVDQVNHGDRNREIWALRLHLVISRRVQRTA